MTKLTTIFENSQRLGLTAAEEAQRFGHPEVSTEHLFLALVVSQTEAGRWLRDHGALLEEARRTVQGEHAHRLAALGINDVVVAPRAIPATGPGEIKWNEPALTLFSATGGDGSGMTLLRALVDEPGGFVSAVLRRMGIDPGDVVGDGGAVDPQGGTASSPAAQSVVYEAYIPAGRDKVWSLLDDPARRPTWDTASESIEPAGPGVWTSHTSGNTGLRWRTPKRMRTRTITVVDRSEPDVLEWKITFPATRRSEHWRIELTDQPGGTGITLTLRPADNQRFGKLARFLATGELTRIASGISRAFRS
ncbi:SRPBCC family protein [Allokutzneria sp. A3M-2-11 16]|uniref:SRPBCC family protein n=1 Tax=Allokutzneria sp. A3M-2-11 16 TaxID=2962043 RepID=UPI0020B868CB|nr:Clp protease N-terminal domain-containing protein [Allokutzneria sp. A3M-2-11 16]MCP3801968.1 SRPBCC family protein [Allokutzneria sp. A3M-2-11 16]